jgi:hypothetical protein
MVSRQSRTVEASPLKVSFKTSRHEIGITREALYQTLAAPEAEGCLTRTETTILLKKSDGL